MQFLVKSASLSGSDTVDIVVVASNSSHQAMGRCKTKFFSNLHWEDKIKAKGTLDGPFLGLFGSIVGGNEGSSDKLLRIWNVKTISRDSLWRTIPQFVLLLGRYEPKSSSSKELRNQMAKLFFDILPFSTMKSCPMAYSKFCQISLQIFLKY